jgi:hypothetical protein
MFVEQNAHLGIARQPRQRGLAVEQWKIREACHSPWQRQPAS